MTRPSKSAHVPDSAPRFASAVLVGANGGIGRALAARLIDHNFCGHLFALSRQPDDSQHHRVSALSADYDAPESLEQAAATIRASGHTPELVLIATGVLHGASFKPEKSLRQLQPAAAERVFYLNTIGPMLAVKALLPLVPRRQHAVVAALSARVGSISDNRLGGWYAYRASKSALNMMLKSAAIEAARQDPTLTCIGLHPGTVDTALSDPFQANVAPGKLFSPAQCAGYLCQVVAEVEPCRTGQVIAWDGSSVEP
ncbi:MAG: SDR family NAD(P)-dependent oxidoreductase [Burkholderiaceae bacterium]